MQHGISGEKSTQKYNKYWRDEIIVLNVGLIIT